MIEQFSHRYDNFFEEPRCEIRWKRLRSIYSADYASFRVLFLVETMGLLDKWREPTAAELTALLRHKISGGRIAIRMGDVVDLFQPVWPLEIAKYEYLVYRATCAPSFRRRYFMSGIRSFAVALVQAWWAFETLMNDFASIIAKERRASLDPTSLALLEETRPSLDKAGGLAVEPYYQPLLPRLQFIYRLLTGSNWIAGARSGGTSSSSRIRVMPMCTVWGRTPGPVLATDATKYWPTGLPPSEEFWPESSARRPNSRPSLCTNTWPFGLAARRSHSSGMEVRAIVSTSDLAT